MESPTFLSTPDPSLAEATHGRRWDLHCLLCSIRDITMSVVYSLEMRLGTIGIVFNLAYFTDIVYTFKFPQNLYKNYSSNKSSYPYDSGMLIVVT